VSLVLVPPPDNPNQKELIAVPGPRLLTMPRTEVEPAGISCQIQHSILCVCCSKDKAGLLATLRKVLALLNVAVQFFTESPMLPGLA
jgi:hypothetical protein